MNITKTRKRKCCICGVEGKKEEFDLPATVFNYLEGEPCICEKCIFAELTCRHKPLVPYKDWKDEIKQHLKEK